MPDWDNPERSAARAVRKRRGLCALYAIRADSFELDERELNAIRFGRERKHAGLARHDRIPLGRPGRRR